MKLIIPFFMLLGCAVTPLQAQKAVPITKDTLQKVFYDVKLDPKNAGVVIITVDLSSLSILKYVSNLTIPVEFYDAHGKLLKRENFLFTDSTKPSLQGRKVYPRPFEFSVKQFPIAGGKLKPLPADGYSISYAVAVEKIIAQPIV